MVTQVTPYGAFSHQVRGLTALSLPWCMEVQAPWGRCHGSAPENPASTAGVGVKLPPEDSSFYLSWSLSPELLYWGPSITEQKRAFPTVPCLNLPCDHERIKWVFNATILEVSSLKITLRARKITQMCKFRRCHRTHPTICFLPLLGLYLEATTVTCLYFFHI